MKIIAAIQADLDVTPLGTKSLLGAEIGGETVLQRTLRRVEQVDGVEQIFVLSPELQSDRARALLRDTRAEVISIRGDDAPWRSLVSAARKWSLDGWRGGVGGATSFDEFVDCRVVAGLLASHEADAVLCVPPAAPVFSHVLAGSMIELLKQTSDDSRMVFAPAPPGLTGLLMQSDLVRELAEQKMPVGWVFTYKPDTPQKDLIFMPCCFELPPELRYVSGRLLADTTRSFRRVSDLLADCPEDDPEAVGRWLARHEASHKPPRPREIELELTTDDPYPDTVLRPRGARVPQRGPLSLLVVERIAGELAQDDDALFVLGGFGDPLSHPEFPAILAAIRRAAGPASAIGICVRTTGVHLTDERIDALIEHGVDVLQVMLDAWSPELYARLHAPSEPGHANLKAVLARLDRLVARRKERQAATPILLPDFTKSIDNVDEMEAFHDGWARRTGAVSITGYSDCAGQCDDRKVISMAPPMRTACRRLQSRCVVLADGTVTPCDQDFRGAARVGRLVDADLGTLWLGESMERVRSAHASGAYDAVPLCASCSEWHRC